MMSGGIFGIDDAIIGGATDLIGGAIGAAFGDDQPLPGYGDKEYGSEARRMRFGQNIGRRIAMGDPTIDAFFQSKIKTDPDMVNRFIDDFGGDFRKEGQPYQYAAVSGPNVPVGFSGTGGGGYNPGQPFTAPVGGGMFNNLMQPQQAIAASNTEDVLRQTLNRLSSSGRKQKQSGYSDERGFDNAGNMHDTTPGIFKAALKPRDPGSGNKYAKLNQERKTGMF